MEQFFYQIKSIGIEVNRLTLTVMLGFFLASCSSGSDGVEFASSADYLNSRIVILGTGIANGTTFLYVEVHSINSDGSVNANWIPELDIAQGAGAAVHNCNATDENGIARCAITSTVPGVKTLSLSNVESITEDAMFDLPVLSQSVVSNVPGSQINNNSNGYQISASLSAYQAPLRYEDTSGHIVYSTVQGVVLSEDF